MGKFIFAKFDSKCVETGRPIKKGDNILYDPQTKKTYCSQSQVYKSEAEEYNRSVLLQIA